MMSESDAHIQEPHDEVVEEEDPNPCESLQPSVVDVLVQKGVLLARRSVFIENLRSQDKGHTRRTRQWRRHNPSDHIFEPPDHLWLMSHADKRRRARATVAALGNWQFLSR